MSNALNLAEALALLDMTLPVTTAQVRQHYRQQVKTVHPDVASHTGHQAFLRLQAAYQLLLRYAAQQPATCSEAPVANTAKDMAYTQQPGKTNGRPVTDIRVQLTEKQALAGGKHSLNLSWEANCHRCHNLPAKTVLCKQCQQTGKKTVSHTLNIMLPKGLSQGSQLRLVKQGIPQPNGEPSDLRVTFEVETTAPKPLPPLTHQLTLTLWQALLGGEIPVQTPQGLVNWRIPDGIQSGATVQFAHMGFTPDTHWQITVSVQLPDSLTAKQRKLIEQCAKG